MNYDRLVHLELLYKTLQYRIYFYIDLLKYIGQSIIKNLYLLPTGY